MIKTVLLSATNPLNKFMSDNTHFKLNGKTRAHFKELLFKPMCNQIIYYDPNVKSEFSEYIEQHLQEIKDFFGEINFEFCYLPEICKQMTEEQVRYRFPDWNGEPLSKVGSDFLKPYLSEEDRDIGACLFVCLIIGRMFSVVSSSNPYPNSVGQNNLITTRRVC